MRWWDVGKACVRDRGLCQGGQCPAAIAPAFNGLKQQGWLLTHAANLPQVNIGGVLLTEVTVGRRLRQQPSFARSEGRKNTVKSALALKASVVYEDG